MQINGSSATKVGGASVDAPARVQVGIDAAVVANHHVCVRTVGVDGAERTDRFLAAPTLAGLGLLTSRLSRYPGAVAVAEPTSMTWLSLSVAVSEAGGQLALFGVSAFGPAARRDHRQEQVRRDRRRRARPGW